MWKSWWVVGFFGVALVFKWDRVLAESGSPQHVFATALSKLAEILEVQSNPQTITAELEVVEGTGIPIELVRHPLEVAVQPPDRFYLKAQIKNDRFEVGRNGQNLWIWEPGKNFGVVGAPGLRKFSAREDSIDTSRLEPVALPVSREQLAMAGLIFRTEALEDDKVEGESCQVIRASLPIEAQALLKWDPILLTIAARKTDQFPVRVTFSDGKKMTATVVIRKLKRSTPWDVDRWNMRPTAGAKVERVALSHLKKFTPAAWSILTTHIKTLGPITGEKKILAVHGKGRLESRDGTRVLFLKGAPEEMGEQHGILLKKEVRDLVSRVLYGVGVGSSFEKGHWFLGEIESCQARIGKFIDPRYLREMDAIAVAAGLEKQEVRLANFFPELFHCSGFCVFGSATKEQRIYHGRVLDYMRGIGLERNAVVAVFEPDRGHSWVNVGYAGFVGSVTAMNSEHLSIGEMGGRGEGNWDGKPMAQLVREVMENAANLDEAIKIMKNSPRTCEYFYVIADGRKKTAVGIAATPSSFEIIYPGEAHPRLLHRIQDAVLMSAGNRYEELAKRVREAHGRLDESGARSLMTQPVCMNSNIHSVMFAPDTLDFWVANADSDNVASHTRYTRYNLKELLASHE